LDVRTPVHSRLAVEWLARFEAMYRIWTPLTGVGNDLTAYRSTLLEEDRPWDHATGPYVGDGTGTSQEAQAAGYVTFALAHFAQFLVELRDLETRFGGVWLLPEAQAETDLREAVHRAMLASPNNERDDSFLRSTLVGVPGREMHGFLQALAGTKPESTDQPRVNQVAKRRQVPSFLGECELRNATEPHRERHLSDAIFSQPRALVSSLL